MLINVTRMGQINVMVFFCASLIGRDQLSFINGCRLEPFRMDLHGASFGRIWLPFSPGKDTHTNTHARTHARTHAHTTHVSENTKFSGTISDKSLRQC